MLSEDKCKTCRRTEEVDKSGYCAQCWMNSPERRIDTLIEEHGADIMEVMRGIRDLSSTLTDKQRRDIGMKLFLPGKVAAKAVRE